MLGAILRSSLNKAEPLSSMKNFRDVLHKVFFWIHLVLGVAAGLVILMMSATGVLLTYQPQMLASARSELRALAPPAPGERRLPLDELVRRVESTEPEAKATAVSLWPEPDAAVTVRFGRSKTVFADPWTGAVIADPAAWMAGVFSTLTSWHRWFGQEGEARTTARAVTGAANVGFVLLGLTGLVIWWPRRFTKKRLRPLLWFRKGLSPNARDRNWHQVTGFWLLPVILVVSTSGVVISYPWAQRLVYTLSGEEAPPPGPPRPEHVDVPAPAEGATPLSLDALVERAVREMPNHRELTLNLGKPGEAVQVSLKEEGGFPAFASTALALDPHTGETLKKTPFEDLSAGRRARGWLRFLHTGEALGWFGQTVAGLASGVGVLLVWTGLLMSWRRFVLFRRRRAAEKARAASIETAGSPAV